MDKNHNSQVFRICFRQIILYYHFCTCKYFLYLSPVLSLVMNSSCTCTLESACISCVSAMFHDPLFLLQLLLIHFGADCTQPDGVGNTPLHMCVDNGHEDVSFFIYSYIPTLINVVAFKYCYQYWLKICYWNTYNGYYSNL